MDSFRIVTWNCNGAFRKKFDELNELNADLLVIQECEDPTVAKHAAYQDFAKNYLWSGPTKNKGLGVFAQSHIKLTRVQIDLEPLELFLPILVNEDWPLLACWTRYANSPNFRYIGQLWKLLQREKLFLKHSAAILIGDLNSNKRWDEWDRWWNHSDVVRELSDLGLESAYHRFFSEEQGSEGRPTLFLQRNLQKAYHIDYGFMANAWHIEAVEVGKPEKWLRHSDHMPVVFDLRRKLSQLGQEV